MKLNERRKTTARLVLMEAQMKGRRVLQRKRPSIASGPRPKWTSSRGRSFLFGQSSSVTLTDAASALSLSHLRVQTTRCTAAGFTGHLAVNGRFFSSTNGRQGPQPVICK